MKITVYSKASDVEPFVDVVRAKADSNRKALGFLPEPVYREAAAQEKLLVAIASEDSSETYAGHLLFGGVFPRGRIFQLYVEPGFRRQGVGRRLIQAIVRRTQSEYFLSISLRVAHDLLTANAFWERMRFFIAQTKPGGRARGRSINVRVRDLNTPSLLDLMRPPPPSAQPDLRLVERLGVRAPVYVLDLNVIFDVVKKRAKASDAGKVIKAGLNNFVRLAVTEELIAELRRFSKPSPTDPVLELAEQLPQLGQPPDRIMREHISSLAALIFPERSAENRLSTQDQSDLVHLVTAIHHNVAGFVTSEKRILRARRRLQSEFGIDVVGVGELAATVDPKDQHLSALHVMFSGVAISALELGEQHLGQASNFLEQMYVPRQLADDALATGTLDIKRRRLLVCDESEVLAFASWDILAGPQHINDAFICTNEDHPAAETVVDHLIDRVCSESSRSGPALIQLRELPGHTTTRRIALLHGFRPTAGHSRRGAALQKVCVGGVVGSSNWSKVRLQLKALAGIGLPKTAPSILGPEGTVTVDSPSGTTVNVTLNELETLMSPVLFLLPLRGGVIVPIRRNFADDLFGASPQLRFLASPEALLLRERAYFSNPRTLSVLTAGSPILFYESRKEGGRGSVFAAARILRTEVVSKNQILPSLQRRGVLDEKMIERLTASDTVAATIFDNIRLFRKPVSFSRLRNIGCVDGSNLVTARRISDMDLLTILTEGQANG